MFKTLPPSFSQLTALETLELSCDAELTREGLAPLKHLQQLKYLKIDSRGSRRDPLFPEWICNNITTSLEHLNLRDRFMSFPPSIGKFKQLTSLSLKDVSNDVPESIASLSLLQNLDVYSNKEGPIALPHSVSKLTALQKLEIASDQEGIAPIQHLS